MSEQLRTVGPSALKVKRSSLSKLPSVAMVRREFALKASHNFSTIDAQSILSARLRLASLNKSGFAQA
jgi:hypothetical protein